MLRKYGESYEVDENTICQCTGLKDKNGNLIWENDIVRDIHGNFYKAIWQNNHYQFSWICVKSDVFFIGVKWDLWSFKALKLKLSATYLTIRSWRKGNEYETNIV